MKRKIISKLENWKKSKNRKPLIINGARKVGKTYSVLEFAKQNYEREKLIKEQKNLFKYKNRNMKESEIINCEEKFLQEPKDNIFKRIFKRVKCIFKLKN